MRVRVTQDIVEVAYPLIAYSPTAITGAGVSQDIIEVAFAFTDAAVRVTQDVIEVAYAMTAVGDGGSVPGSGGGGTQGFGYAN